jgi:hypothetical protein
VANEAQDELRTAAGRERALDDHEKRIDRLEGRVTSIEAKEASRDKRWGLALNAVIALGVSIVSAIVVALLAGAHL